MKKDIGSGASAAVRPGLGDAPGCWRSLAVAALAALVPCVIVPLQTWLGNTTALGFGMAPLLKELAILWLAVTVAAWLFQCVASRWLGALPTALVIAAMFYLYLESGILTIGSPPLDGGLDFWFSRPRIVVDTAILVAIVAGAIALRRAVARNAALIAGAIAILAASSLFDVQGERIKTVDNLGDDANPFASGIVPRAKVIRSAFFSANRNVVVFILDSTTTEVFCDVLDTEPDIARKFEGFCVYRDVVGRYATTPFGVASMFSGHPYDGTQGIGDYVASPFSAESPLYQYLLAEVPMFVQLGTFKKFSFTNRLRDDAADDGQDGQPDASEPVLSRRIAGEQGWNLSELMRFRLTPFAAKRFVMKAFMVGWGKNYRAGEEFKSQIEECLYPQLKKAPIVSDEPLTLHIYHTRGTHDPYALDKNGKRIPPVRGYDGSQGYTCFVLKNLGGLLDAMRQSGIYDNATIIITADHGNSYSGKKVKFGVDMVKHPIFNRAFPCFAVKVPGAHGPFKSSQLPVTHGNFAKLLAAARAENLTADRVDELLSADGERIFTNMTLMRSDGAWEDYVVLPDGVVTNRIAKPKRDVSLLPPIQVGKDYSFKFLKSDTLGSSYPPVACDGLSDARVWGAGFTEGKVGMTMRVPDPQLRYDVTLGMNILQPAKCQEDILFMGQKRFFLRNAARGTVKKLVGKTGDSASVTLHGLVPNPDGTLSVTAEKRGTKAQVFFVSIRVNPFKGD